MIKSINNAQLYIGIMSGTSADGIDLALVDFSENKIQLIAEHFTAYTQEDSHAIMSLYVNGDNEIERSQALDVRLAKLFASTINTWLNTLKINHQDIIAIGNHGQTIRHRPTNEHAFTLQVACNQTLAALTGINVIGDFRKKDIAYGGQGAPLVPAFHKVLFKQTQQTLCIVNIGGISNISYLPNNSDLKDNIQSIMGFDTGPGNALMDAWCLKHTGKAFDKNGEWALLGQYDHLLLEHLLTDNYFHQAPPKSTGREYFHLAWLNSYLDKLPSIKPVDVQATLLELTAYSIANDIKVLKKHTNTILKTQVYLCGGGALNPVLAKSLKRRLPCCDVEKTEKLNIDGNILEAMAFAWFAYAFNNNIPGNIPSATGAKKALVLGSKFSP